MRPILGSRPPAHVLLFVLLAATCVPAHGGGPGTASGTFLRAPVGAGPLGMGGAYMTFAEDAYAPFYNPAGLGRVRAREAVFQHNEGLLDSSDQYVAYTHPYRGGAFGLAWRRFDFGNFDRTTITGGTTFDRTGSFDAASNALSVGYGWPLRAGLSAGVQGKFVREDIAEFDATAFAADLGLHYRIPGDRFNVGLTVQNLGTDLKFRARDDRLPRLVRLGIGYRSLGGRLLVGLDLERAVDSDEIVRLGTEFWVTRSIALRAGYDSTSDEGANVTVGIGFRRGGLSIDYAYSDEGLLEEAHRVTLGYRWDETAEPAAPKAPPPAAAEGPAPPAVRIVPPPFLLPRRGPEETTILVLDLRGDGAEKRRSAALAEALRARGYRVRRAASEAAARRDDPLAPEPDRVVWGSIAPTGFTSLLIRDVAAGGYVHAYVPGDVGAEPAAFGEAAADAIGERLGRRR